MGYIECVKNHQEVKGYSPLLPLFFTVWFTFLFLILFFLMHGFVLKMLVLCCRVSYSTASVLIKMLACAVHSHICHIVTDREH